MKSKLDIQSYRHIYLYKTLKRDQKGENQRRASVSILLTLLLTSSSQLRSNESNFLNDLTHLEAKRCTASRRRIWSDKYVSKKVQMGTRIWIVCAIRDKRKIRESYNICYTQDCWIEEHSSFNNHRTLPSEASYCFDPSQQTFRYWQVMRLLRWLNRYHQQIAG